MWMYRQKAYVSVVKASQCCYNIFYKELKYKREDTKEIYRVIIMSLVQAESPSKETNHPVSVRIIS